MRVLACAFVALLCVAVARAEVAQTWEQTVPAERLTPITTLSGEYQDPMFVSLAEEYENSVGAAHHEIAEAESDLAFHHDQLNLVQTPLNELSSLLEQESVIAGITEFDLEDVTEEHEEDPSMFDAAETEAAPSLLETEADEALESNEVQPMVQALYTQGQQQKPQQQQVTVSASEVVQQFAKDLKDKLKAMRQFYKNRFRTVSRAMATKLKEAVRKARDHLRNMRKHIRVLKKDTQQKKTDLAFQTKILNLRRQQLGASKLVLADAMNQSAAAGQALHNAVKNLFNQMRTSIKQLTQANKQVKTGDASEKPPVQDDFGDDL